MMPTVAIRRAGPPDEPVVERLLQLYEYDASDTYGADLEADGRYHVVDLARLWRPDYAVHLITVDGHLAGFAFVTRHASYLDGAPTWLMDEFFVLRKYRRRGVGGHVARTLFDGHPGRWELGQLEGNTAAQAFWRAAIGRYTGGGYQEARLATARWQGPVQTFVAPGPAAGGT
jgi:predicted acetyltransferase